MICFYHEDDDGKCAGYIVRLLEVGDQYPFKFTPVNYGRDFPIEQVHENEFVYIVDFSIPPEIMDELLEITPNVIWIDHHKSAIEMYKDYDKEILGIRHDGIAGCMLTWIFLEELYDPVYRLSVGDGAFNPFKQYFNIPECVQMIADYDVWRFKFGNLTKYFHEGLRYIPHDPEDRIWHDLFSAKALDHIYAIMKAGEVSLENRKNFMKTYCKSYGFKSTLGDYNCLVVNMGGMNLNDFIVPEPDDYDIFVSFCCNGNGWHYSLRSTKVDCSEVAKLYDGGGHKGAAEFHLDRCIFK